MIVYTLYDYYNLYGILFKYNFMLVGLVGQALSGAVRSARFYKAVPINIKSAKQSTQIKERHDQMNRKM